MQTLYASAAKGGRYYERKEPLFKREWSVNKKPLENIGERIQHTREKIESAAQTEPTVQSPAARLPQHPEFLKEFRDREFAKFQAEQAHTVMQPADAIPLHRPAFVPSTREGNGNGVPGTGGGGGKKEPQPERLEFLEQFRDYEITRFQFGREAGCFAGYACVVYPRFFHLDLPEKGHAAFHYPDQNFLESLGIHPSKGALDLEAVERLKAYLTEVVLPAGTTKKAFAERGAERLVHHPDDWQQHFHECIRSRIEINNPLS